MRRCCHGHSNVVEAHAVISSLARQTGLRSYHYTTQKAYARRLKMTSLRKKNCVMLGDVASVIINITSYERNVPVQI